MPTACYFWLWWSPGVCIMLHCQGHRSHQLSQNHSISWVGSLSPASGCAQDHPQESCGHHLPAKDTLSVLTQWCGCKCRCIITQPHGRGWPQVQPWCGTFPDGSAVQLVSNQVVFMPLQMCQAVFHLPFPEIMLSQWLWQLMFIHARMPSLIWQIAALQWQAVSPTVNCARRAKKTLQGWLALSRMC